MAPLHRLCLGGTWAVTWKSGPLVASYMRCLLALCSFILRSRTHQMKLSTKLPKVLGKLLPHWGLAQSSDKGDSGPYGSKDPVDLSPQIAKFPLDVLVKDMADQSSDDQYWSEGEKAPGKAWKKKPISREFRAQIKNYPDIYWKLFPSRLDTQALVKLKGRSPK